MNPASVLESNIEIIRSAVLTVCRRHNIHGEEAEEFASQVYLKFIEDDYRRLRSFQGKSSLHTYLVTVVTHILIDMIREKRGRWRPSEKARSLGQDAVILEELLYRENHTFEEAYQILTTNHRITISREQAYNLATKIPRRLDRGSEISLGDALETHPDSSLGPEEIFERERHGTMETRLDQIVEEVKNTLSDEDRLMLRMWFEDGITVSEISRILGVKRSEAERKINGILSGFKEAILRNGINIGEIEEYFSRRSDFSEV